MFLKKLKIEPPYDQAISTSGFISKRLKSRPQKRCPHSVLSAEYLRIIKIWKQLKYPSTNELIKKYGMYIQWNIIQF